MRVRVRCSRKESSRSLSHLLMSFLYLPAVAWLVYPSSQSDIGRLNPIFRTARNWQLTNIDYTIQDLAEQADAQLF